MNAPLAALAALGLAMAPLTCRADDASRALLVSPTPGLGTVEAVSVFHTRDGQRLLIAERSKFDAPIPLPHDGPFEVVVKPKGGLPVVVLDRLTVKPGTVHRLRTGDVLGTVEVFGDDLPRAEKIVITDVKDPGPGEKGHVAVQSAGEYRAALLVPPGTYAVWVVPANGARPQRVVDNVRVQAGRSIRVGD
jgi:hypothetical protein